MVWLLFIGIYFKINFIAYFYQTFKQGLRGAQGLQGSTGPPGVSGEPGNNFVL